MVVFGGFFLWASQFPPKSGWNFYTSFNFLPWVIHLQISLFPFNLIIATNNISGIHLIKLTKNRLTGGALELMRNGGGWFPRDRPRVGDLTPQHVNKMKTKTPHITDTTRFFWGAISLFPKYKLRGRVWRFFFVSLSISTSKWIVFFIFHSIFYPE